MELLEFERQGIKIDDLADKYARMAGEIELLRGMQAELREAGAGSDVLAWYDQQIAAIQAQRGEMSEVEKTITDIEKRLEALDLEGRFLALTKSINFDPLERQIDRLVNNIAEMPFDEIVRQILEQQALIAQLTPQYDALAAAVEAERAAVEAVKAERDGIKDQLDVEEKKLQDLKDAYSDIEAFIQEMENALSEFQKTAEDAANEVSRIEELFNAAADLDFEDFGGGGALGREGFLADIEAFNEELQRQLEEALASMNEFDLAAVLETKWEDLKAKFREKMSELRTWLSEFWNQWWPLIVAGLMVAVAFMLGGIPGLIVAAGLLLGAALYAFGDDIWDWVYENVLDPVRDWGWEFIDGFVQGCWDWINEQWQLYQEIWDKILNWVKDFFGISSPSTVMKEIGRAVMQGFIDGLKELASEVWGFFTGLFGGVLVIVSLLWGLVGAAVRWVWENVIQPVWDEIKKFIDEKLVPAFNWLKERGKEAWELLGNAIDLVYDTVIKPVFDGIKWTLENVVVPAFEWAAAQIDRIWTGVGAGIQWVWDNVIDPVWGLFKKAFEEVVQPAFEFLRDNIIKPIMETIFNAIKFAWNNVAGVIETGINFFGSAWNKVADAVNAVTDFLGLGRPLGPIGEVKIDRIENSFAWPKGGQQAGQTPANAMASGGVVPNSGGVYNAPTAIVGEGSKLYPEFVIPTDPRYRDRAFSLMQSLGTRLMQTGGTVDGDKMVQGPPGKLMLPKDPKGAPKGGGGGGGNIFSNIVGGAMDAISSVGGVIANGAIRALWAGPSQLARLAIDQIPVAVFKTAATKLFGMVDEWVTHIGTEWDAEADARVPAVGDVPTPAGGAGSWKAVVQYLQQQGIAHRVLSTFRPGAVTRTTGNPSWHGMDRAVDLSGPEGMVNFSASSERIAAAVYAAFKGQLHELIWGGTQAYNVWNGSNHNYSSALMREHYNHVHVSLAEGGRFHVPRTPGGVNMNVAEGRSGEEVQVLPLDETTTGGTTIIINGNLEFPNITDGDDAKNFIENLRALAMQ